MPTCVCAKPPAALDKSSKSGPTADRIHLDASFRDSLNIVWFPARRTIAASSPGKRFKDV